MTNRMSHDGAKMLRHHEGVALKAYLDPVEVLTIGAGFTWQSGAFQRWWRKNRPDEAFSIRSSMTREECDEVLRVLIDEEYGAAVNRKLPGLRQHEFDGAASVTFNAGIGALSWKWADALRKGDVATSAKRLRTTAITARRPDGTRVTLPGLVKRRKDEARVIEAGEYTFGRDIAPINAMSDGILSRGEAGAEVAALLRNLKSLGLYDGALDNRFGHGAQKAVLEFQRSNGLTADGLAGPITLALIDTKVSESQKKRDRNVGVSGAAGGAIIMSIVAFWEDIVSLLERLF